MKEDTNENNLASVGSADVERERLIDNLAFLVVQQYRRQSRGDGSAVSPTSRSEPAPK